MSLDNLSPGTTRVSTASFLKKKMVVETKDFDELRKQSVFNTPKRRGHERERKMLRKRKLQMKHRKVLIGNTFW